MWLTQRMTRAILIAVDLTKYINGLCFIFWYCFMGDLQKVSLSGMEIWNYKTSYLSVEIKDSATTFERQARIYVNELFSVCTYTFISSFW